MVFPQQFSLFRYFDALAIRKVVFCCCKGRAGRFLVSCTRDMEYRPQYHTAGTILGLAKLAEM